MRPMLRRPIGERADRQRPAPPGSSDSERTFEPSLGSVSVPGSDGLVITDTGPPTVLVRLVELLVLSTSRIRWPLAKRYTIPGSSICTGLVTSGTRTTDRRLRGRVVPPLWSTS